MENNIISRIFGKRTPKVDNALLDLSAIEPGWHPVGAYGHYRNDSYENGYSSIRAIANRFMVLKPFAVDEKLQPLKTPPNVINVLSRPNSDMSGIDFRDALAVMTMVHDKTYILVHERFGAKTRPAHQGVRESQIAGFTFLEGVTEVSVDGDIEYVVYENNSRTTYYPHQVIELHDVNPNHLSEGYSPTRAAKRWTRIDDYIADYQSGFFENGAVPAGQFVITAPTAQDYSDIVKNLKKKHRGAGKNNNVTYTYQPIDPNTGKAGQASITWVPFNTTNKDLSLKDIFEQTNKKIDSVYGVSAFIRAIDDAPNYATAQVVERNFVENTVRPFAVKKWARFLHELNRITGGVGYGISFDLVTPNISDEEKAHAETNQIRVTTLTTLTGLGYTLDSSVKALGLPKEFALLQLGETTTAVDATIEADSDGVDDAPVIEDKVRGSKRTDPKVSDLTQQDIPGFEERLKEPARVLMQRQVDRAVEGLSVSNLDGDATEEDKDTFVDEMMVIIGLILLYGGIQAWEAGKTLLRNAGIPESDIPSEAYTLTGDAESRYRAYLYTIADSYSNDTAEAIRRTLARASAEQLSRFETENLLKNIMNTDAWRITRIAVSEVNRSGGISSVEAMIKIEDDSEVTIEKALMTTGPNPCEYCLAIAGQWFPVKDVMFPKGEPIIGIDGGVFINNWDSNAGHDIHANGLCVPEYRIGE